MPKLTKKLIDDAYVIDKWLGGQVKILYKHKVVGTSKVKEHQKLKEFLAGNNVPFEEKQNLIWLHNLEKGVATILNKNKNKENGIKKQRLEH